VIGDVEQPLEACTVIEAIASVSAWRAESNAGALGWRRSRAETIFVSGLVEVRIAIFQRSEGCARCPTLGAFWQSGERKHCCGSYNVKFWTQF